MPVEAPVIRAVWFVFAIVPGNARPVERTGTFEQRTHQLCWDDQCKGCSSRGRRYRENAENASESDADVEDPNCGPHPCAGSRSGAASSTFELLPRCPPTGNVPPLAVELSDWGGHVFYGAGRSLDFSSVYARQLTDSNGDRPGARTRHRAVFLGGLGVSIASEKTARRRLHQ